jgi:tellurite resistance protein TerC
VAMSPKLIVVVAGVFMGMLAMRFVSGFFVKLMEKKPILKPTAYVLVGYVGLSLLAEEIFALHMGELGKAGGVASILTGGLAGGRIVRGLRWAVVAIVRLFT